MVVEMGGDFEGCGLIRIRPKTSEWAQMPYSGLLDFTCFVLFCFLFFISNLIGFQLYLNLDISL